MNSIEALDHAIWTLQNPTLAGRMATNLPKYEQRGHLHLADAQRCLAFETASDQAIATLVALRELVAGGDRTKRA